MRRAIRHAALVLLAAALGSCSMFDYSGMVTHKYALVYGVTIYTMAKGYGVKPNLQYPDSDASSIYAVLASNGYTVHGRWVAGSTNPALNGHVWVDGVDSGLAIGSPVATSPDGSSYSGQGAGDGIAPSKARILSDIQALSGTIGPNDVLLIYFSGHGTQTTNVTPAREYFDPYAAVLDNGSGTYYDFPAASVRDDELATAFAAINTPRKVLILDTCNSGGFVGNVLEVDTTPPVSAGGWPLVTPATLFQAISNYASMQSSPAGLSPYGAQVLSAAGRDESCYEWSVLPDGTPLAHGVMTFFLLQGLQGFQADLNKDGHVTVLEAFAFTKAGIEKNWNSYYLAFHEAFEPHISGGPVDFVLF